MEADPPNTRPRGYESRIRSACEKPLDVRSSYQFNNAIVQRFGRHQSIVVVYRLIRPQQGSELWNRDVGVIEIAEWFVP